MWIAQQTHPLIDIISDCLTVWACLYLLAFGKNDEANIYTERVHHTHVQRRTVQLPNMPRKNVSSTYSISTCVGTDDGQRMFSVSPVFALAGSVQNVNRKRFLWRLQSRIFYQHCVPSLSRCFFVCFCEDGLNVVV